MTYPRWQTLREWLAWQEQLHPKAIDLRLERLRAVWDRLGPPPLHASVMTVGGTNGKGSTVAYLEAICRAAGIKTGVYTSPHLLTYNERIRVDGQEASDVALCAVFDQIDRARGQISLTYFEFGTLAALLLFSQAQAELLVLEVGLGGRLDAVNMLDADVSIVTSIGLDHVAYLGADLDQIAFEKAGIFRCDHPAIIGSRQAPHRLREEAERRGARVSQLGVEYDWQLSGRAHPPTQWSWRHADGSALDDLPLPRLRGTVQLDNAAAALAAFHALHSPQLTAAISTDAKRSGLVAATLPGRFQLIPGSPCWVLDVAHNPDAIAVLVENLRGLKLPGRLHLVFSVLADKNADELAGLLAPLVDHWYLAEAPGDRAMPLADLIAAARGAGAGAGAVSECASLSEALSRAHQAAASDDGILVTGSFVTVEAGLRYCCTLQ